MAYIEISRHPHNLIQGSPQERMVQANFIRKENPFQANLMQENITFPVLTNKMILNMMI